MFGLHIFRETEYEEWPRWVLVQSRDGRSPRRQLRAWPDAGERDRFLLRRLEATQQGASDDRG